MNLPKPPSYPLETVREWLRYDPETGDLWWINRPSRRVQMSKPAGSLMANGYRLLSLHGRDLLAHHVAWFLHTGAWPTKQVDHRNGNRLDNRACNLRLATPTEQNCNTKVRCDNVSGRRGVYWDSKRERWSAEISFKSKKKFLGYFAELEEAAAARHAAEINLFGEFRRSQIAAVTS